MESEALVHLADKTASSNSFETQLLSLMGKLFYLIVFNRFLGLA